MFDNFIKNPTQSQSNLLDVLNKILMEKSDPGLEKIIKCFEDGSDFIFNEFNHLES